MNNTNKSTPVHTGSGPLFQTPILSPDENTFIRSPYEIPKMRKLSYLMDADQILEENYNYHDSNKLFYKHKEQNAKESAINMTNKILNQCQKAMTNPSFFQERSSFLSENDEFCSEQAYLHKDLNKSKSEEFSIVSMPAKLENLEGFDGFNFAHEKTLESTDRDQRLLEHEEEDLNIEKSSDIFQENSEILNFKEGNAHMNIAEYNENLVRNPQKDKVLHELQLKDAIHRQNLGKMRRFIDELKKELDECKGKNEILLKERENDAVYIKKTNKEIQSYENSMKKIKKENQELKARNIELELVLKEILFEQECHNQRKESPKKTNIKQNKPLQNITNCPKNHR